MKKVIAATRLQEVSGKARHGSQIVAFRRGDEVMVKQFEIVNGDWEFDPKKDEFVIRLRLQDGEVVVVGDSM